MPMIDVILAELEQESAATRRLLERIPEDKLAWRPAEKSMSLGQLALHIATLPSGISRMLQADSMQVPDFHQAEATSRQQLLDALATGLADARQLLGPLSDEALGVTFSVLRDGATVMALPKAAVLRMILLNHNYHHRGQLTVYLRLLGVALPSVYGPSADENPFA